jgi:cell wall-associated NlpC family hydrolase
MPGYGAVGNYNSVGVKNYATPQQGIQATAATLMNGKYANIIAALKQGQDPRQMALALANSPWGTGALVLKVLGGGGMLGQGTSPSPAPDPTSPTTAPQLPSLGTTTVDPLGSKGSELRSLFASSAPNMDTAAGAIAGLGGLAAKTRAAASADIPLPEPIQMAHVSSPTGQPVTFQGYHGVKNDPQELKAATLVQKYLGTPYVWGGAKPGGFDCSGLVQYVNGKVGVSVPRTTYAQWDSGTPVKRGQLQPGDAVFFTGSDPKNGKPGHEGMYIGNGKFVEAPHTGGHVQVSTLAGRKDYVGARRF